MPERIAAQRLAIDRGEQELAARTAYHLLTGEWEQLRGQGWNDAARGVQDQRNQLSRMQAEQPRRWANGFSCLAFTLVGAGVAIRRKHSDVLTSFFMCFLPILLAYYPLLMFSLDRAKAGSFPPISVWLANVFFALWGLWLLRRVLRY